MINFINKNLVIVHGFCHYERYARRSGREGENAGFLENTKDLVSYLFQARQDSKTEVVFLSELVKLQGKMINKLAEK